nr:iron-sulfur cluster assembly 1 homolog, mitochondrial isoform X1 [Equus caballus]XP_044612812.1 iron-sulfur cluster assembly 1 homolog, mitochondrial isoform X1 [Equus asinus]
MSASLVRATVRAVSKRKLQPTRAALTLTPSAVNKIKQLLKDKPEHVGVKVGVRTRGCNGLSYTLEYTKTKGDSDEEVVQDDYCVGKRGQTGSWTLNPLKEILRHTRELPLWLCESLLFKVHLSFESAGFM